MTSDLIESWGRDFGWRGFSGRTDLIAGHPCHVVMPPVIAAGHPWVWKPEFLDHFPAVDEALLHRGACVVHLELPDHYGCPTAVTAMNEVYRELVSRLNFSPLLGIHALSRAGLWAYNWAAENPARVACIYADNPVCDIKSWPGGLGETPGSPSDWKKCLAAYDLTEEEAHAHSNGPLECAPIIAGHRNPVLQVLADADEWVPISENGTRMAHILRTHGGDYTEIIKPGALHHPHGLADPTPILTFFEKHLFARCDELRTR